MNGRYLVRVGVAILVALGFLAPGLSGQGPSTGAKAPPAAKAKWTPPRTPWGDPDLQGTWNNSTIVPLERPDEYKGREFLTDKEVEERFEKHRQAMWGKRDGDPGFYNEFWWEWGKDTNRTSLIIDPPDGKLPLTPEGQEAQKARDTRRGWREGALPEGGGQHNHASWLDMNSLDRCITRSLPGAMMPGFYGHYYQILQTPDHVAIWIELIHDVRIIPLRRSSHVGQGIRQWLGDARGRWEGDTLVVETTNLNDKVNDWTPTFFGVGRDLRLIERFKRIDGDTIDYQFTVNAPAFTRPWTAAFPYRRVREKILEYACHEGNYAMKNSLSGARAVEAAAQKSAKP